MSLHVRIATHDDVSAVVTAVGDLLVELDGARPDAPAMEAAAQALIDDRQVGALLVAQADGEIVGVLAASWQIAIHVPGTYALIQDLWVSPDWRGKGVGADLLGALFEFACGQRIARVEVGLPQESFARFDATEKFYLTNGFTPNGPRMKRLLS